VQYPGEKEIAFPPFTCLESDGEPRVERTQEGEVVIFPLKASVNPKAETLEELHMRRKSMHLGMCKLLREDLALGLEQRLACCQAGTGEIRVAGEICDRVAMEFDQLIRAHRDEEMDACAFNEDERYKALTTEVIDGKKLALVKLDIYLESAARGSDPAALDRIRDAPLAHIGDPTVVLSLRTGATQFPWAAVVKDKSPEIDLGDWNAAPVAQEALEIVATALGDNANVRVVKIKGVQLALSEGWATARLAWADNAAVKALPATVAVVLRNCRGLTSLDLRSNSIDPASAACLAAAMPHLTALHTLDLSLNALAADGAAALAPALATLTALRELRLNGNGITGEAEANLRAALASIENLRLLI